MAKAKSKAIPKPGAVATEQGDAQARTSAAIQHYDALLRDLRHAQAIMDVLQAVTEPESGGIDGLGADSLSALSGHARDLLGTAQIEAAEVFECFRLERQAAEVAHG